MNENPVNAQETVVVPSGPVEGDTPVWMDKMTEVGLNLLAAVLIFVIGRFVAKTIKKLIARSMGKTKVDPVLISFTCNFGYSALMVFVILAALSRLGVQTTSFIAVIGAAGLAVGLALQGSLSNFAAGVLMVIFRPFKIGDFIDAGGVTGIVRDIHIFTTTLNTPDNKRVIVPNSKIMGDSITNFSAEGTRRIELIASISYSDDIDKAEEILMDEIKKESRILPEPAPTVGLMEMGDSSINFVVRPWVKVPDYWNVYFALNKAIKKRIEAEGMTIPFPQRDVHIYQEQ
ncbi:mechanosensitive ion channel family protein [Tichowtungia aerotolerans]|nr:mechanosensitive ion channel domain-containing protein [Tichowtungia aerotolerans]